MCINPYHPPEVMLGVMLFLINQSESELTPNQTGMKWDQSVDVFTTGCVVVELFMGHSLLYVCDDIPERLACLERLNSPFTSHFSTEVERGHLGTFCKDESLPRIKLTTYPIPIEHNVTLEEVRAINRVGGTKSLFVSSLTLIHIMFANRGLVPCVPSDSLQPHKGLDAPRPQCYISH
jgi:hypothetical protein